MQPVSHELSSSSGLRASTRMVAHSYKAQIESRRPGVVVIGPDTAFGEMMGASFPQPESLGLWMMLQVTCTTVSATFSYG
jgi:hypothetical protein